MLEGNWHDAEKTYFENSSNLLMDQVLYHCVVKERNGHVGNITTGKLSNFESWGSGDGFCIFICCCDWQR